MINSLGMETEGEDYQINAFKCLASINHVIKSLVSRSCLEREEPSQANGQPGAGALKLCRSWKSKVKTGCSWVRFYFFVCLVFSGI